jgi:GR25 family glycosyltransferase involved in LPS biosynthesis
MTEQFTVTISAGDEETWYALLQHSRSLRETGDEEGFVKTALKAFRQRPHRAEPLHDLARHYLTRSRGDLAVIYAEAGLSLPIPEGDYLGIEPEVYHTGLKEAFTIAASYSTDPTEKERGRVICNWLSLSRDVPDWVRGLARLNYHWYAEPAHSLLPSIQFRAVVIDAPDGFKPGNISIAREREGFVALIRAVNYDLLESGFFDRHGDTSFRQRTLLAHLDENLKITSSAEVFPPDDLPPPEHADSIGFEDPRPILWRGDLWCISCVRQLNPDGRAEMVLARVGHTPSGQNRLTEWRVLASGTPVQWEKNWMPQVIGEELRFVYSSDPVRILGDSGNVLHLDTPPIAIENHRGGSQAIPFDGGWLMLVHDWQVQRTRRYYFHRFVWLDQNNRLSRISRRFFFQRIASEFAAGLAWHATGDRLVVSFGTDGHEPTLALVEAYDIRAALLDIADHRRAAEQACASGRLTWEALTLPECSLATAEGRHETDNNAVPTNEAGSNWIGNIHLINLDMSVDRLTLFHARNSDLAGVIRVSAIDGRNVDRQKLIAAGVITDDLPYLPGSLGCALSHVRLWKKSASENRVVTIFEDDVICSDHFRRESAALISKLSEDWDIIQWGYNFHQCFMWLVFEFVKAKLQFYDHRFPEGSLDFKSLRFSSSPIRVAHSLGLMAYSVSPKGARALLNYCLPLRDRPIPFPGTGTFLPDLGIDVAMCGAYRSMQAFICMPPLVIHDRRTSDRIERDVATASTRQADHNESPNRMEPS